MKTLTFRLLALLIMLMPATMGLSQIRNSAHRNITEAELADRGLPVKRLPEAFRHKTAGQKQATGQQYKFGQMHSKGMQSKPMLATGDGTTLYGNLVYSAEWTEGNAPLGIYSFKATPGTSPQPVIIDDTILATGGGTWIEGKYHVVSYISLMGFIIANYEIYDATTWQLESSKAVSAGSVAIDMTYDETTGEIYGCFLNDAGDGFVFGKMSVSSGERTEISALSRAFYVMAANTQGEIYGISEEGDLCRFDKETGNYDKVGPTGITGSIYLCSGTFDPRTGKLYWALCADSNSGLYEIDLATGAATLINEFLNQEEFQGVYIPKPLAKDGAPDFATDFKVEFINDSKSGKVSFTMPVKTFAGDPLSGDLKYIVYVNEQKVKTGNANTGENVTVDITVSSDGETRFSVRTENQEGLSPQVKEVKWIGNDYPSEPVNVELKEGSQAGELILTWETPAYTLHGGYLNKDLLSYNIVRFPDKKQVATNLKANTFTDKITNATYQGYSYEVTAVCGDLTGGSAVSNIVTSGQALELPFFEPFNSEADFNRFTIIDAAADGKTWQYDAVWGSARANYAISVPKDDWLVTPPLRMTADHVYLVDFRSWAKRSDTPEILSVSIGTGKTAEALNKVVLPAFTVKNDTPQAHEIIMTLDKDGDYHVGFHAESAKDRWWLYVDSISVKQGPKLGTPARVTNLTVKPGTEGSLNSTITATTPAKTVDGKPLSAITKINILRGGEIIGTIDKPAVNSTITFEDKKAIQGVNEYSVIAVNEKGDGLPAVISTFIGFDVPLPPVNVVATEVDGKARITWEAPGNTGVNNAYVDVENLVYQVVRISDGAHVGVNVKELSFTDAPDFGDAQGFVAYAVFAQSTIGMSTETNSNQLVLGKPFELPFRESFPNKTIATSPWGFTEMTPGCSWSVKDKGTWPDTPPQDNDGGLVTFIPADQGGDSELYSAKISLANAKNPVLEFYYYYVVNTYDHITVNISVDNGKQNEEKYISFTASGTEGWTKASIDLKKYIGKNIQLHFIASSRSGEKNIHFDNIIVKDLYKKNLLVSNLQVPFKMTNGEPAAVTVEVRNDGQETATAYNVNLIRNGKVVGTQQGANLAIDATATFTFEEVPTINFGDEVTYAAEVIMEGDENTADNKCADVKVAVKQPRYPTVTDLAGEVTPEGKVMLTWSEPNPTMGSGEPVVDGIEEYEPFSIANIGEWGLVDLDGSATYGISIGDNQILEYPHAGDPMAYQVWAPAGAGIDVKDPAWSAWAPYEGEKCLLCFAATSKKNDDWLISPELTGDAQEISFYAKSVTTMYGEETFEIYYSKTGSNIGDFTMLSNNSAPETWTEFKASLPIGTRYFAIRCTSQDRFALLIDNIKYMPASEKIVELGLIGFNVYRDDNKLTAEPLMDFSYIDENPSDTEVTYRVTTVYDKGESVYSNAVVINVSGIEGVTSSTVTVLGLDGFIRINDAIGCDVAIYAVNGTAVYMENVNKAVVDVPLATGVYIVKIGNKSAKIAVK